MPQAVTIRSLARAFAVVKGMQAEGLEWGEGYRGLGREAIAAILRGQMDQAIDAHLDRMAALDQADRRNGSYRRHLLTELGEIEVAVPRTRPLKQRYRLLMLDGVVLSRKTGAGAVKRPVLVALGLRPDGKKEVIDFRL